FVAGVPDQVTVPLVRLKATGRVPMLVMGSGGQSLLVGYEGVPPTGGGAATQGLLLWVPPMQTLFEHSGHGWMPAMVPAGSVDVSPVRKMTDDSGALRVDSPVPQSTVPLTSDDSVLSTHTLVGVLTGFGTASGAPKRHAADVQLLRLP